LQIIVATSKHSSRDSLRNCTHSRESQGKQCAMVFEEKARKGKMNCRREREREM
jgi:hypothetical protein